MAPAQWRKTIGNTSEMQTNWHDTTCVRAHVRTTFHVQNASNGAFSPGTWHNEVDKYTIFAYSTLMASLYNVNTTPARARQQLRLGFVRAHEGRPQCVTATSQRLSTARAHGANGSLGRVLGRRFMHGGSWILMAIDGHGLCTMV